MDSKFKLSDKKNAKLKNSHEHGILLTIEITLGYILVQKIYFSKGCKDN